MLSVFQCVDPTFHVFIFGLKVKLSGKIAHSADIILIDHSLIVTAIGETVVR